VANVQRDALLEQAIEAADLPALILEKFPDCITHRGAYQHATKAMFVAVWRGEKSPSVSLGLKAGRWLWHDFGNHEGGNSFTFLTRVCGLTSAQAAQELLERAGLANTAHTGSRVAENERDRQLREFKREHPQADESFFDDWLEIRATGWREFGTPVGRAAMEYAATAPNLPDFPGELIAHTRLGLDVPLERPPFGPKNLEALALWIAEALRPAIHATGLFMQSDTARIRTPSHTQKGNYMQSGNTQGAWAASNAWNTPTPNPRATSRGGW
jgi:hypothetical protein